MADLKNKQLVTLTDKDNIFPIIEVINNLTSSSTTLPLSAAQGKALKDLIDALKTIEWQVVEDLPGTGQNNIVYLVANNSGEDDNAYDEYIWIASKTKFEKLGTFAITQIPNASSTVIGGIKIGYSTTGKNYAVQLDSSNKAYVNVPWTDTNTTYNDVTTSTHGLMTAADKQKLDGIEQGADVTNVVQSLKTGTLIGSVNGTALYAPTAGEPVTYGKATSSTLGLVALGSDTVQSVAAAAVSSTASRTYAVQLNNADQLVVNVPWTDTNTTYAAANATTLGLVKLVNNTIQTVAPAAVSTTASRTYAVQMNDEQQLVVNVPWINTTYNVASTSANGLMSSADKTALNKATTDIASLQETISTLQQTVSQLTKKLTAITPPEGYELVIIQNS